MSNPTNATVARKVVVNFFRKPLMFLKLAVITVVYNIYDFIVSKPSNKLFFTHFTRISNYACI
jgi:hypothetical protein